MEIFTENDLLIALAIKVQENMQDEAIAVKGYTEQGDIIRKIAEKRPDLDVSGWEAINDELISDELNHQLKLNALYAAITGIEPNKD